MTRFYCFINGKIKRSPKNLELDINVAKTDNSVFFHGMQQIPECSLHFYTIVML